jgi:3-oxoacyl-[acyl-carrier protein] reductase
MDLVDKAAIVTGASRGVGAATARALAARGCAVLINYNRSRAQAEELVGRIREAGGTAVAFGGNVAEDEACRAMVEAAVREFGRLDVLINNAGTTRFIPHGDLDAVSDDAWQEILGVNLIGPFQCIRAAIPHLKAGTGAIVNVASVAGFQTAGSSVPYGASKAALINMTVNLARSLGPEIRVNAVAPGFIDGDWLRNGLGGEYEAVLAAARQKAVLRKVCRPENVAEVILSLVTGADLVTGQTLVVDGGQSIGPRVS